MMRNLACMASTFNDTLNFGIMDFIASEKIWESYDVKLDYGKTTPALIIFDKGLAYPAKTGSVKMSKLEVFATNYTENCQLCP